MDRELFIGGEDGLAVLRINRPDQLNTLSLGVLDRFRDAVLALTSDPEVRAIMITGTGRAFCAGGAIDEMTAPEAASKADRAAKTLAGMRGHHAWLAALRCGDKPVLTAVNGVAAGGGFGLAMLGDIVVASEKASFKSAFLTLGASPDYGLGFTLPRAVGAARAAAILYGDRRITAGDALGMGMIAHVFPAAEFEQRALDVGRGLARMPLAAQLSKRLLRLEERASFSSYLEAEAQAQAEAFASEDFAEGVAAFMNKRAPIFTGL
jgi:2-(1,2-epoxy-1,2-dihydrophenyl)acetyl-CoA isomerase